MSDTSNQGNQQDGPNLDWLTELVGGDRQRADQLYQQFTDTLAQVVKDRRDPAPSAEAIGIALSRSELGKVIPDMSTPAARSLVQTVTTATLTVQRDALNGEPSPLADGTEVTPEELRAAVTFTEAMLNKRGGDKISEGKAIEAWTKRVHGDGKSASPEPDIYDIGRLIYRSLPEEMRTKDVIASLDLRPYLALLRGAKIENRQVTKDMGDLGHPSVDTVGDHQIDLLFKAENDRIGKVIDEALSTTDTTYEQRQQLRKDALMFDNGTVGPTADMQPELLTKLGQTTKAGATAQEAATATPAQPWDPSDEVRFPVDEMRIMVESGQITDYNQFLDTEAQMQGNMTNAGADGGYFPVTVGEPKNLYTRGETISALDASVYLTKQPEDKVREAQRKMVEAGYYDRVGKGAAEIDWGDPFDEATQLAWKALLLDSVRRSMPVPQLLASEAATYREKVRQARLAQMGKVSDSGAEFTANDLAQQLIGRNLSYTEWGSLRAHLEALQRERAGVIGGDTGVGPADNAYGFTSSDIENYVRGSHRDEMLRRNFEQLLYLQRKAFG